MNRCYMFSNDKNVQSAMCQGGPFKMIKVTVRDACLRVNISVGNIRDTVSGQSQRNILSKYSVHRYQH